MATSDILPLAASGPVSDMPSPILIGSSAAAALAIIKNSAAAAARFTRFRFGNRVSLGIKAHSLSSMRPAARGSHPHHRFAQKREFGHRIQGVCGRYKSLIPRHVNAVSTCTRWTRPTPKWRAAHCFFGADCVRVRRVGGRAPSASRLFASTAPSERRPRNRWRSRYEVVRDFPLATGGLGFRREFARDHRAQHGA